MPRVRRAADGLARRRPSVAPFLLPLLAGAERDRPWEAGGSAWVDVVMDRRGGLPHDRSGAPAVDRRRGGRRSGDTAFRRAYRGDDFDVYEATAPLPGRCPHCGALVTVELPRFAEPPARLELAVRHELILPVTVRHVVELQSLSATGRVLLATRLVVRTRTEPT